MKLTVNNIKRLRRDSDNKLFRRVCSWTIEHWSEYSDKTYLFKDVLYHGCQSGVVSELIWYSDTVKFYKKYQDEINDLLKDFMDGTGIYAMNELFGKNWDDEDPLAIEDYNRNLLAWFGFEETLRNVGQNFDQLQDCI